MSALLFKKLSANLVFCFIFALQIGYSQTVENFTVVDTDGNSHNLYTDYLDKDKTVLIKIMWAGCPPCNAIAKDVQALYVKWGSGEQDVEFIELGDQSFEGDQAFKDYKSRHGITFVTVSPDGNSIEAVDQFDYSGTPTFVVVAPDRSMVFDPVGISEIDAAIASVVNAQVPDCPTNGISISSEADLESYKSQYPNCTDLVGNITVDGSLSDLRGLEKIKTVQGTINISSNSLSDLSDLSGLENITSALKINNCSALTSLAGLEKLNVVSGSIELSNLEILASLDGLKNVQSIGGKLNIENCNALESLAGLDNLSEVGSDFIIASNSKLTSLAGLEAVDDIKGKMRIDGNPVLTSIQELSNLDLVGSLDITNNQSLSDCAVQSICNLIDGDLSIPTNISGNASGCESLNALNTACAPAELPTQFSIQILDAFDKPVEGISLSANDGDGQTTLLGTSDPDGLFNIELPNASIPSLDNLVLEYEQPSNSRISGVSVLDLIRIQNHIIGTNRITDPYLLIAADANRNGTVSVTDLIIITNAIIGKRSDFGDGKIIEIVNEDCNNDNSNCSSTALTKNPGNQNQIKLRAIRIGDING